MTKENYKTFVEWLEKEPNVDLIIPAIKEDINKKELTTIEIDSLRSRVIAIKKYGHDNYLKLTPEQIGLEIFDDAIVINDKKSDKRTIGNCCERNK